MSRLGDQFSGLQLEGRKAVILLQLKFTSRLTQKTRTAGPNYHALREVGTVSEA